MIDVAFAASIHWDYGAHELSARKCGSFVYFIQSGDFIKIGWSKTPELRVDQIRRGGNALRPRAGLAEDPVLLAYKPGTKRDEAALHQQFADQHDQGEWFRQCPELEALIEETVHIQSALEVDAHIASYEQRVTSHGWPAMEHNREARIQEQLQTNAARRLAA